nr:MAG TPA: hypothetical protein [Caudoviricetes sp.]DAY78938.1 MAG TPA: hypothetical protein [Caudoviricetes sp.]
MTAQTGCFLLSVLCPFIVLFREKNLYIIQ